MRQRRTRIGRMVLVFGIIIAVVCVIFYFQAMRGNDLGYARLPVSPLLPITAFGENVLCYDNQKLLCYNSNGDLLWSYDVGDVKASYHTARQDIVVWNGSQLHLLSRDGAASYSTQIDRDIIMARAGGKYTAVLVDSDKGSELRVIDKLGETVDTLILDTRLLDCGFFDQDDKLWTLSLNLSGSTPEYYIGTYQPSTKREMSKVQITSQMIYGIAFNRSQMLLLGTRYVDTNDFYGKTEKSKLVYGWEVLTRNTNGSNTALVFAYPSEMNSSPPSISGVRVIYGDNDYSFRFPVDVSGVLASQSKVYGFTRTALISADYSGENLRNKALPFAVDRVIAYLEKDRAVVVSDGAAYVLSLN